MTHLTFDTDHMEKTGKNILVVAGEPSGDMRAAEMLKELKKVSGGLSFWGVGGDRMEEEGVELLEHTRDLSIVGVWEAVKKLSLVRRQFRKCLRNIDARRPDAAILIDYPGFNLSLARYLHKKRVPVIYYVIPQVWAWGENRVEILRKCVDKVLVLFDFERTFLKKRGVDSVFVGHPLIERASPFIEAGGVLTDELNIALLPGSRKNEITELLPVLLDSAERIRARNKDATFTLAENSNVDKSLYDSLLAGHSGLGVKRVKDNTFQALSGSRFAIVASGTATLETAVMNVPMVVVYKASLITSVLCRLFVKVRFLGLVNLLAGKEIAPELLQQDAVPDKISRKVADMLDKPELLRTTREELRKVTESLGGKGASRRAAEVIAGFLRTKDLI